MLAGVYINEFWGVALYTATAMLLPMIAVILGWARLTLFDWKEAHPVATHDTFIGSKGDLRRTASMRACSDQPGRSAPGTKQPPTTGSIQSWRSSPTPEWPTREQALEQQLEPLAERYQRWLAQEEEQRRAVLTIVKQWRLEHRLPTFGITDPAKVPILERYILMLSFEEQALLILKYGLLDGRHQPSHEIMRRMKRSEAQLETTKTEAMLKIDAFHQHANAPNPLDLVWDRQKEAWISHKASKADRKALTRARGSRAEREWTAELRSEQWLALQLEAIRKLKISEAQRGIITACGLIETWQVVRGLTPRKFHAWNIMKASQTERCLILLDLAQSTEARSSWLSQLTRYNPAGDQKYLTANGAIKPRTPKDREWRDIEAIESASEANWLLGELPARDRLVLELSFGITSPGRFDDAEIAQLMHLELTAVREIKLSALSTLKEIAQRGAYRINP